MKKTSTTPKTKVPAIKKIAATKSEVKIAGEKVMTKYSVAINKLAKR